MEQLNISPIVEAGEAVESLDDKLLVLRLELGKLKAALERAFAPVASVVVPVLTSAVRAVTEFVSAVGQVIGGLFGFVQEEAVTTTRTTGSAVKKALADFDELNRLSFSGGSSTTTVTTPAQIQTLNAELVPIVEKIRALIKPLQEIDFSAAVAAFGRLKEAIAPIARSLFAGLEWAWYNILVPVSKWAVEQALPVFLDTLAALLTVLNQVITALKPALSWLWETVLKPMGQWAGQTLLAALQSLTDKLLRIGQWIESVQGGMAQFGQRLNSLREGLFGFNGALSGWVTLAGTVRSGMSGLLDLTGRLASAFGSVTTAVGGTGSQLDRLLTDLQPRFRTLTNGALTMINGAIGSVQAGINAMVGILNGIRISIPDWVPNIGGKSMSLGLKTVSLPSVPYLAKGAVLPANKPFLAVVGDQKNGTNVEAPLSTIEEAVANVLGAGLAGQDDANALLRQILAAIEGITVGDETIGRAARRYERRMAVMGGVR